MAISAGMLGAALCASLVYAAGPGHDVDDRLTDPGVINRTQRPLSAAEEPAMRLLQRAVDASRTVLYSGAKLVTGPGPDVTVDIWHYPGRGTVTYVEDSAAAIPGEPTQDPVDDGMDELVLATLTHGYTLDVVGTDECIGRSTHVVAVRLSDTGMIAAKLWLDEATGLLLRRQMYAGGHQIRTSTFVEFAVGAEVTGPDAGGPPAPDSGVNPTGRTKPAPKAKLVPQPTQLTDAQVAQLRADGWPLPDVLPGHMQRYRAYELTSDGQRVVQLSFSDGLFSASLFVQRGQLDGKNLKGFREERVGDATVYTSSGLYRTVVWAGGDTVYTLVSDASATAADGAVIALPHRAPDASVLGRIGRGIARVASWINPFD